jgi:hypothetical protein
VSTTYLITLIAVGALSLLTVIYLLATRGPTSAGGRACGGCKRMMLPAWEKCLFCGWAPGARLEFMMGPMANQTLPLSDDVTTIGSVAGNTVILADPAVSKKHAGIRKVEGNFELADLGSSNGVYVNGQKVPKKTLVVGDVIRVGNSEAVFKRD